MKPPLIKRGYVQILALVLMLGIAAPAWAVTAHVSWDPNGEGDLAGYIVCYGTVSLNYNEGCTNVGNTLSYDVDNLLEGVNYYFALKAVDNDGNQSALSDEATFVSGELPIVVGPVDSIQITPPSATIDEGENQQYSAVAKDGQGIQLNDVIYNWSSSNPSVASVDVAGVATALSAGSTKITAEADAIISNEVSLLVQGAPDPSTAIIEIQPTSPSIDEGTSQQFTAVAKDGQGNVKPGVFISWSSDNPSVATVDGAGVAQGVTPGIAKITAFGDNITSNQATLSIAAVPEETTSDISSMAITVTPNSGSIETGNTKRFSAIATDETGNGILGMVFVWDSTNPVVASVDTGGTVTGYSAGTTMISASIGDVVSNEALLQVTEPAVEAASTGTGSETGGTGTETPDGGAEAPVDSIQVDPKSLTMSVGSSQQFSAVVKDQSGGQVKQPGLKWSSTNPKIVSVDESGVATGFSKGKATITASLSSILSNKSTLVIRAVQQSSSVSGGCGFVRMKGGRPPNGRQIAINALVFFAPLVLTKGFKAAMEVRRMTREQIGDMFGAWNMVRATAVSLSVLMCAVMTSEAFTMISQAI